MILNDDQKALFQWITAGLCIDEVRLLKGDAGYLLGNMIAKFTLASSNYLLSEAAFKELIKTGLDMGKAYKRSRESLDKRGLSGGSEQERVPLTVNCF
jgi:hypothetical protein